MIKLLRLRRSSPLAWRPARRWPACYTARRASHRGRPPCSITGWRKDAGLAAGTMMASSRPCADLVDGARDCDTSLDQLPMGCCCLTCFSDCRNAGLARLVHRRAPRLRCPLVQCESGFWRSGDKVSFVTTGTRTKIANSPSGKPVGEVSLVIVPDAGIGQAAHRSKHTAAEDAVADGERAADLERIAETGEVSDVGNEFLAVAKVFVLRIERAACPQRYRTLKMSPVFEIVRRRSAVMGTWLMAL